MSKFQKKPVVIDAVLWTGSELQGGCPDWLSSALGNDIVWRIGDTVRISTLEGLMTASPGDYIIQGDKGEIYPCKSDIFTATYEPCDKESRNG